MIASQKPDTDSGHVVELVAEALRMGAGGLSGRAQVPELPLRLSEV